MKAVVILMFLSVFGFAEAVVVICDYSTKTWTGVGSVYSCSVKNDIGIKTKESALIDSASSTPSQAVNGFWANQKQIHFFPRNLEKVFPSLIAISIKYCHLKEVKRGDLKTLPNIRYIELHGNDIEIVEKDLFAHNINLEFVSFGGNRIFHIDPNVFDHLHKLLNLWLHVTTCVDKYVYGSDAVKSFIAELKSSAKCIDPQYSTFDRDLLAIEDPNLNSENFLEKFNQLKNRLATSNLRDSLVSSLRKRIDDVSKQWFESSTIAPYTSTSAPASLSNNNDQMTKWNETENRLTTLETELKAVKPELKAGIKQVQIDQKNMQTDLTARMSALEAMTQKILEAVGNLTIAEEEDVKGRCDGEWNE